MLRENIVSSRSPLFIEYHNVNCFGKKTISLQPSTINASSTLHHGDNDRRFSVCVLMGIENGKFQNLGDSQMKATEMDFRPLYYLFYLFLLCLSNAALNSALNGRCIPCLANLHHIHRITFHIIAFQN